MLSKLVSELQQIALGVYLVHLAIFYLHHLDLAFFYIFLS